MKIFPSLNEQLITITIFSFIIGAATGLFTALSNIEHTEFITILAALFAAFFGAATAFFLESRARKTERRSIQLEAANQLLYVLFERLNKLKLFQIDFIEPHREDPARMITMLPLKYFHVPDAVFRTDEVSFLFKSHHKELLFELHVVNERFFGAVDAITYRSDLHLNMYQPKLEAAGHVLGDTLTDRDIKGILGERNYLYLEQATDHLITDVDNFVERADKLRDGLIKAFRELFGEDEVFAYKLQE